MGKGRTGPALYELIRKASEGGGQGRLDTPKWWRSGPPDARLAKLPLVKRPVATAEEAAERDPEPPVRVTCGWAEAVAETTHNSAATDHGIANPSAAPGRFS